jgi:hypothetical protein
VATGLGMDSRSAPRIALRRDRETIVTDGLPTAIADWFHDIVGSEWTIRQVTPLVASSAIVPAIELDRDGSSRTLILRHHDQAGRIAGRYLPLAALPRISPMRSSELTSPIRVVPTTCRNSSCPV